MLSELFEDFDQLLASKCETTPTTRFIYNFLEEMSIKSPSLTILHGIPDGIVSHVVEN
jgi:hypothetical protein